MRESAAVCLAISVDRVECLVWAVLVVSDMALPESKRASVLTLLVAQCIKAASD